MSKKIKMSERVKANKEALQQPGKVEMQKKLSQQKQAMLEEKQRIKERMEAKKEEIAAEVEEVKEEAESLPEALAAQFREMADGLIERFNDLVERVQMAHIIRDTTRLGNQIEGFPQDIQNLRDRGYIFRSYLENKIEVFAEQWDETNDRIEEWLDAEMDDLDRDLAHAQVLVDKISVSELAKGHKPVFEKLEVILNGIEREVETAEERIKALYDELSREVSKTESQLNEIAQYLDWIDEAEFELANGESVYMVAKAEWDDGGKKPDGMLYLTDQRLLFEQKEKVGKRLGMFGGKQVQDVLWEAPLSALEDVDHENKGMLGGKDMINMKFGSGASYSAITVEVKGGVSAKLWATQIKRAARGTIHDESTVEQDEAFLERLREAPTDCPNCGATLPQISGNLTETSCKYCGNVIRI